MKSLTLVVLALCVSGCFRAQIRSAAAEGRGQGTKIGWTWLWGITPVTDRAPDCEYGLASADTQVPAWGMVVFALTGGIVAPVAIDYVCAAPPPLK